ncbi:thioredoxin domain-containing protein [Acetobacteraceae bacterium KSS8]|uniref:Thioredoxin domain-containing protein n=1 Tax=Endosaccharibacter trunci TaxID=2812733 RepID=A0ABT1W227_9PROT|nr:thioredoxin domain-containing protein [Acetobacteraceae bacterium KSS8]
MSGGDTSARKPGGASPAQTRRRVLALLPFGVAAAAGGGFWAMLSRMRTGGFDPHDIHAPALNRTVPDFALPGLDAAHPGFSGNDLRHIDRPVLVNFFASWCIPCVAEAPLLGRVAALLPVWGVAYENKPSDAAGFVSQTGAPFARVALDGSGRTAIDWGVSGVPESFLVRPGGIIDWHLAGALTETVVSATLPALLSRIGR